MALAALGQASVYPLEQDAGVQEVRHDRDAPRAELDAALDGLGHRRLGQADPGRLDQRVTSAGPLPDQAGGLAEVAVRVRVARAGPDEEHRVRAAGPVARAVGATPGG